MQRFNLQFRPIQHRLISTSALRSSSWSPGPAPPRLPKEEQEIFEQLLKKSRGAFSTPTEEESQSAKSQETPESALEDVVSEHGNQAELQAQPVKKKRTPPIRINQSPHSESEEQLPNATTASADLPESQSAPQPTVKTGSGEELHPNIRRGAPPEFEGDINPSTGESGGPKNEPLRWGHGGDWSYNGRVTDF